VAVESKKLGPAPQMMPLVGRFGEKKVAKLNINQENEGVVFIFEICQE
jgi:hypothetical protein